MEWPRPDQGEFMTEILKLVSDNADPINDCKISNEIIKTLYTFSHINVRWSHLFHAQRTFHYRQYNDDKRWIDLVTVYVGLPNWVKNLADLKTYNLPHVEIPLGYLEDLFDCSSIEMNIGIPYQSISRETGELSTLIIHSTSLDFIRKSNTLDSDIQNREGAYEHKDNHYEKYVLNAVDNFANKKQLVAKLISEATEEDECIEVVWAALSFAYGLSIGRYELFDFFKNKYPNAMSKEEAETYFSNLTVKDFYIWSSDYFVMNAYFKTLEELTTILEVCIKHDENASDIFEYAQEILERSKILH